MSHESNLSGVIDTAESKLSGVINTTKSNLNGVNDTAESKLSGIIDTAESAQTPLSQFEKLEKTLRSFKEKMKSKFKQGWTILPKAFETKTLKMWFHKETFLTQQCHWHRWVNFEFEYLGDVK